MKRTVSVVKNDQSRNRYRSCSRKAPKYPVALAVDSGAVARRSTGRPAGRPAGIGASGITTAAAAVAAVRECDGNARTKTANRKVVCVGIERARG